MPERIDKSLWQAAEAAVIEGSVTGLRELFARHPELLKQTTAEYLPQGRAPSDPTLAAQAIITQQHFFRNFEEFASHQEALRQKDSLPAQFEQAVEATIGGDLAGLEELLRERPDLVRARSPRTHRSTLLHYVGANGVEVWRQKTPENAVQVVEALLRAGADVNAEAEMYGGGATTLGLVATSIHPWTARVVEPLLNILLQRGARMGGPELVNACLANGRPWAAEYLATCGAILDLEGAAGVGRLDVVQTFFTEDGTLNDATSAQMQSGFAWACEYGRAEVVEFLLKMGMPIDAKLRHHGQTGLHWAAYGAHFETAKLLLTRGAPVNARDEAFDGTPLGWALYGWGEGVPNRPAHLYPDVVSLLVNAGGQVDPEWLAHRGLDEKIHADEKMSVATGDATKKTR